jgi:hypothetical protein
VAFDGNRYSVPWRLVGKPLTLRADAETVTLWYGRHRVARHARCWRRGLDVILPAHADGLLATKPGAQAHWQVEAVQALGPAARQYLELIRAGTRSLRAELDHLPGFPRSTICLRVWSAESSGIASHLTATHLGSADMAGKSLRRMVR